MKINENKGKWAKVLNKGEEGSINCGYKASGTVTCM